jgi:nucleotide-binding universal stress UspA family protein
MQIARILCPTDFSEFSTHALEQSVAVARRTGARITALAVLPSVSPVVEDVVTTLAPAHTSAGAELARWRELAEAHLQGVREPGVDIALEVIEAHPVEAILARATSLDASLIVMGTHGAGGFRRLVLGSVTEKVLRRAACPVLTVPPRVGDAHASAMERVLVALDFSPCSVTAAEVAAGLARDTGGDLTLMHVIEWPWHDDPLSPPEGVPALQTEALREYREYLEQGAVERLRTLAATLPGGDRAATWVRFGTPYVETLQAAMAAGADLIVLGVRGRSSLDLGFFGSTTNHVVRTATCPVLTVRS